MFGFWLCIFLRKLFFLSIMSLLMCYVFLFVLYWLCAPENNPLPLLQNMAFDIYIYICIYIYVCVGVSQNEVSCFPLKATVLEPKKDTSFWDIPTCVYIYITYILFFDMCCLFLSSVSLSHPKNMFSFLLHVVWQPHCIRKKSISNQNMLHWKLQYI